MFRIWIAFAALGLLTACQQAGGAKPAATAGDPGKMHYFEAEFDGLFAELGSKLERACVGHAIDADTLDACLRDQFADAFDDSGQGRRNCEHHVGVTDFMSCVAIGNTFLDVRRRLADTSPVPDGFWTGEGAMVDAVIASIVRRGVDACKDSGDSERVAACIENWFEDRLELPADMTARCEAGTTAEKERHECFGEAIMLRYMRDHVPRLDAIST